VRGLSRARCAAGENEICYDGGVVDDDDRWGCSQSDSYVQVQNQISNAINVI
jgi:hypothetical protein